MNKVFENIKKILIGQDIEELEDETKDDERIEEQSKISNSKDNTIGKNLTILGEVLIFVGVVYGIVVLVLEGPGVLIIVCSVIVSALLIGIGEIIRLLDIIVRNMEK